ncbi:MAG TPA: hypothetical protein DD713_06760 [Nitrospiraceae bacterium]|nr:hypothetical protein [Nitrospiraceae bacterium]
MGDREFDDITPESLINRLQTQESSGVQPEQRQSADPLNTKIIRERFLNALKEIAHLEKALEEKNTALASTVEEKDRLFHALNKAFEDKKKLQDRIADIDIVRNMEIVDFKAGLDKLRDERDFLLKEKDDVIEDLYKRDQTIEELKYTIEKKGLQLQEIQADMDTALEAMRKTELKCKELETRYKAAEQRKTDFVETSPLILNNLPQNTEAEPEHLNKIEYLNNTLAVLKTEIDEKTAENVFLRNEISLNQTDKDRDNIASETSEAENINNRLTLAAGKNIAINEIGKTAKELSADKKLLYVKSPKNTEFAPQLPEKMIYVAPAADMKKKALRIAILFILGMAGILLAYKLF